MPTENPPTKPAVQLKVALVYRMDHPGGVQSCVLSLIQGLNAQGIVPEILWDLRPDWALLDRLGLQATFRHVHFPVPSRWIDRLPISLRYLARIPNAINGERLSREYDFFYIFYNGFLLKPATAHVRYLSGPPLLPQLVKVPKGLGGLPFRLFQGLYRGLLRHFFPVYEYHRGSSYVINSQFTAELFKEAHGVDLPVVTPPIDLAGRDFAADDLPQRDTVTFFGRIIHYKRPELFLDLVANFPQMRALMMGAVPQNRVPYFDGLRQSAQERGLQHVEFLSNASGEQVQANLRRTRFYVFPGINEHFGMATAEAVASGALPFVHDSGGQREIVPDERLRFTDETMQAKFAALLDLPNDELNRMRLRLAEHVRQYAADVFNQKMLAFLRAARPGAFPETTGDLVTAQDQ